MSLYLDDKKVRKNDGDHITLPKSKAKHFVALLRSIKTKVTKRDLYSVYSISSGASEAVARGNVTVRTGKLIMKAYNDLKAKGEL